jgi:hypothetical protein
MDQTMQDTKQSSFQGEKRKGRREGETKQLMGKKKIIN